MDRGTRRRTGSGTDGEPGPAGLTAFPDPDRLAGTELEELRSAVGITGSRARTLLAVAELFARTGPWPLPLPPEQWDERAASLLALPGVGPWTRDYLRMRLFGDPDAVPVGDLVLRRALAATWTPVPGWAHRAHRLRPVEIHPWPWLARPAAGSAHSFSAWRRTTRPR